MRTTTVVVIGGGQAGLAMSSCLSSRGIDHVVLERGGVANSWRTERWDSLRLLTPNWMTRLPGHEYTGDDPDGYMTAAAVATMLDDYRAAIDAPVQPHTSVTQLEPADNGFTVHTDRGPIGARSVVVATGAASRPHVPAIGALLPATAHHLTAVDYRNPDQIGPGRVLVVGASASGAQIADEVQRAGHEVLLAVGDHVRLPRMYRGRDIHWWMDAIGQLDERWDEVDDLDRARRLPSLQLVGSPEKRDLGLNDLTANGVALCGRLVGVSGPRLQFSGSLANFAKSADLKQNRLLDRIDEFATECDLDHLLPDPVRPRPTAIVEAPLEVAAADIGTVIWATGHRPTYPWLDDAFLDGRGRFAHDGGVGRVPGSYILGLPFQRRRKSSFIDGVGADAMDLAAHLHANLSATAVA